MNTPIISLIGQPNVGKSSLFNLLIGKKHAIVSAQAGVTRDRQFSKLSIEDRLAWLVDTAGLSKDHDKLSSLMYEQSRIAAEQADLVLLVVDGSLNCHQQDIQLARFIQKSKTPMCLVINKLDITSEDKMASYRKIGAEHIINLSCTNRTGLNELKEMILGHIPKVEEDDLPKNPTVAIVGKPNAGKSTLTNHYAKEDRCIVSNIPGTPRDAIAIDLEHRGQAYTLIDTAGMRRKSRINEEIEQYATANTLRAIDDAQTIIHLIDATDPIARQDFRIIHLCLDMGKSVIIGVNKIDCLSQDSKKLFRDDIQIALSHLKTIPIIELSATQGRNTHQLMKQAILQAQDLSRTFNTSFLTRVLEKLVKTTPPPTRLGRPINLRMAHTSRQYPLEITIKGKRTGYLPKSYIRYLMSGFIKQLDLKGRTVKLKLESDHNPYDEK